jgi:hypothetical protein
MRLRLLCSNTHKVGIIVVEVALPAACMLHTCIPTPCLCGVLSCMHLSSHASPCCRRKLATDLLTNIVCAIHWNAQGAMWQCQLSGQLHFMPAELYPGKHERNTSVFTDQHIAAW